MPKSEEEKKVRERSQVTALLRAIQHPIEGLRAGEPQTEPDFIVPGPSGTIGIEICGLDHQQQAEHNGYIVGPFAVQLSSRLVQIGLHDLVVTLGGAPSSTLFARAEQSTRARVLDRVFDIIKERIANASEMTWKHSEVTHERSIFTTPFEFIFAWRKAGQTAPRVQHSSSSFMEGDEFVQATIRKKDAKLQKYRGSGVAECWLLLITGGWNQVVALELMRAPLATKFDRLFLLDEARGLVEPLKMERLGG